MSRMICTPICDYYSKQVVARYNCIAACQVVRAAGEGAPRFVDGGNGLNSSAGEASGPSKK